MTKALNLCEELRQRLAASPDGRLASKSELVKEFGVSAGTVSNAIRALKDEGRLRSVPGKGVFLVEPVSSGAAKRKLLIGVCGCYLPGEEALSGGGLSLLSGNGILQGVQSAALASSSSLAIVPWSSGGFDIAALRSLKLDGLLIAGGAPESELQKLARCGIPALLANYPAVPAPQMPFLDFDNAWAVEESVRLLKERGRKRIAFLTTPSHSVPSYRDWLQERFAVALAKQGLSFHSNFAAFASSKAEAESEAVRLLGLKCAPDGIVCWSADVLAGASRAAKELGLSIPGELSAIAVCSFSGKAHCSHFLHDGPGLGMALFNALRRRIDDPFANVSGFVKPQFIDRGTL